MAEHGTETPARHIRSVRFLIAASVASALVGAMTAVQLVEPDLDALALLNGLLRPTCVVLWICYIVARAIDPDTAAYCLGYVDGVARRFPGHEDEDRVTFTNR